MHCYKQYHAPFREGKAEDTCGNTEKGHSVTLTAAFLQGKTAGTVIFLLLIYVIWNWSINFSDEGMSYLFLLKGDKAGSRDTHNPSTMMQEGSEDTMRFGLKQQKKI